MTTNDLNRRVAEAIEPKPDSGGLYDRGQYLSIGSAWESHHVVAVGIGEYQRIDWQPRKFDTDENANALLLELMPLPSLCKVLDGEGGLLWSCFCGDIDNEDNESHAYTIDRKLAVRAAFLAMIETPEGKRVLEERRK